MSVIKHERGLHPLKGTVKTEEKESDIDSEDKVADKQNDKEKLEDQIQSATDDSNEVATKINKSEKK